jgi:hypothetical protein
LGANGRETLSWKGREVDGIKEAAHKGERHVSRPAVDTLFIRRSRSWTLQSKVPTAADLQSQLEAETGVRRLVVDARELTGRDSGLVTLLRNRVSRKRRGLPLEGSTLRLSAGIQHALQALEFDRIQRRDWGCFLKVI